MSMTILRSDCLCFLVKFWKMSQFSSCSSLKPTARWWFSRTDESLYMRANSESKEIFLILVNNTVTTISSCCCFWSGQLTCVNEELVGNSGVVHIMYCTSKHCGQDLKVSEYSLETQNCTYYVSCLIFVF